MQQYPGYAMAVQPDQKILVATYAVYGTLIRLNANGTLDSSFGTNGIVNGGDGEAISVDANGRIVVARIYETGNGNNVRRYVSLKRLLSTGQPDNSFGSNGTAIGFQTTYTHLNFARDNLGGFLVGSVYSGSPSNPIVGRFTSNGLVDTSFHGTGSLILDYAGLGGGLPAITTQSDGKIVVAAEVGVTGSTYGDVGVYRLNYDGSPDLTFGNGGKTNFDIQGEDHVGSVAIQQDPGCACEKIIVGAGGPGGALPSYATFARLTTF